MATRASRVLRRVAWGTGAAVGTPILASVGYAQYLRTTTPEDEISESHNIHNATFQTSIWYQSITNLLMTLFGQISRRRLDASCENAAEENERLLLSVLKRCKDTSYGIAHNFSSIQSREDFRRKHPLTNHDHYSSYIDQIVHLNEHDEPPNNIMFPEKPRMIAQTSGTSGTAKLIPVSPLQRKVFFLEGIGVAFDTMVRGVPTSSHGLIQSWPNLQKSCKLMFTPKYSYTVNGLKVGPNSSTPGDNKSLLKLYSTPPDAYEVETEPELLFLHALYALLDRNLGLIESNFILGVFNMFSCMDRHWDDLVETVRSGKFPKDLDIPDQVRTKLECELVPNPKRAEELAGIRISHGDKKDSHKSFARRIWPKLHTIMANETGSFHLCGRRVREKWTGDDITIFSPLYGATEGLIGVNTDINGTSFSLCPKSMFFEFLPVEESDEPDERLLAEKTLFLEELQEGKEYEMIITNLTGLYRYRFGDIIRCVGYRGQSPIVEIAYRRGQFLNAQGERTSEETLYRALAKTANESWGFQLKDYTAVEYFLKQNGSDHRPRYTVYLELEDTHKGKPLMRSLDQKEIDALDKQLGEENHLYKFFRSNGRLQCIEAITVPPGTFEKLRRTMVDQLGTSPTQTKQPRVTRHPILIQILQDSAVA